MLVVCRCLLSPYVLVREPLNLDPDRSVILFRFI